VYDSGWVFIISRKISCHFVLSFQSVYITVSFFLLKKSEFNFGVALTAMSFVIKSDVNKKTGVHCFFLLIEILLDTKGRLVSYM